jgi:hypothetical protein
MVEFFQNKKTSNQAGLCGEHRDQIAKDNGIGAGTVNAIVKQTKYEMEQGLQCR